MKRNFLFRLTLTLLLSTFAFGCGPQQQATGGTQGQTGGTQGQTGGTQGQTGGTQGQTGGTQGQTGGTQGQKKGEKGDICSEESPCADGLYCQPDWATIQGKTHDIIHLGLCQEIKACNSHGDCAKLNDPSKPSCITTEAIEASGREFIKMCSPCGNGNQCDLDKKETCVTDATGINKCVATCTGDAECGSDKCAPIPSSPMLSSPGYGFTGKICMPAKDVGKPSLNGECDGTTYCLDGLECAAQYKSALHGHCGQTCSTEAENSPDCTMPGAKSCVELFNIKYGDTSPWTKKVKVCVPLYIYKNAMDTRNPPPTPPSPKNEGESCTGTKDCDYNLICVRDSAGATTGKCLKECSSAEDTYNCKAPKKCELLPLDEALPSIPEKLSEREALGYGSSIILVKHFSVCK